MWMLTRRLAVRVPCAWQAAAAWPKATLRTTETMPLLHQVSFSTSNTNVDEEDETNKTEEPVTAHKKWVSHKKRLTPREREALPYFPTRKWPFVGSSEV